MTPFFINEGFILIMSVPMGLVMQLLIFLLYLYHFSPPPPQEYSPEQGIRHSIYTTEHLTSSSIPLQTSVVRNPENMFTFH